MTPGEAGNGALPRDSRQIQEGAVPSEETSGRRHSQSRGKCDTKARGSSYKPRYTRAPGNAGERGTKGVIATSASPGSHATNCSAPGHPSRETGTHTRQPHATRGALRPPLQGCPGPRQASRLLFYLPPPMKSELGLCRASPSLLPTAAFLKCGEQPGHRVPTHSCPPVMFSKRPQIRGKGPSVPSETPLPLGKQRRDKRKGRTHVHTFCLILGNPASIPPIEFIRDCGFAVGRETHLPAPSSKEKGSSPSTSVLYSNYRSLFLLIDYRFFLFMAAVEETP